MFYYARNLAKQTVETGMMPWDWPLPDDVTKEIREVKDSRQDWYRNVDTVHYFYTGLEGVNPNMRPSKENPPRAIHSLTAEYDIKIPEDTITKALAALPIKPAYVERSLGGNVRLVWLFERPILTGGDYDFTTFILDRAIKWLNVEILPAFDEGAFTTPTRLLCNGCNWTATGAKAIAENEIQAFFMSCSKAYRFKGSSDGTVIPLDLVEAELKKRYPGFDWPNDFVLETQGPTFWIPESTSPLSAILKQEGFITFSAHASKPFYNWIDLLGAEFVRQFTVDSLANATKEIWWDGKRFWRKKGENYTSLEAAELSNFFRVNCRLSAKPGPEGISPVDSALNLIYNEQHIAGAAPFVFRPTGLLDFMGRRVLNTYTNRPILPAESSGEWGADFPFIATLLDNLFDPAEQKDHFLAWWKHFYTCAINQNPKPGQNAFLMGGVGVGKTLLNRHIIGPSVGGHVDASDFLIHGANFNSELFEAALWCVDDETASENDNTQKNFSAMIKKCTANSTFKHNKKFEVSVMTEWMGRILCTTNLDYVSSRLLGSLDNSSQDKTNLFRCTATSKVAFPSRDVIATAIKTELPFFLKWLLTWEPPAAIVIDSRFGYRSYHEPSLLRQANHGGRTAPFRELLREALTWYFEDKSNKDKNEWRGNTTQVTRLLLFNPLNDTILRSMRLEQVNRYMESVQREGKCTAETGIEDERIWVFTRPTEKTNEQAN